MIKVQPSASRIVKTETPDRLLLSSPPGSDVGMTMLVIGIAWVILTLLGPLYELPAWLRQYPGLMVVMLVPGVVFLTVGLVLVRRSWTLERSGEAVVYTRKGLFGDSVRTWPAGDVASFWVEVLAGQRAATRYVLQIGFRNGRSEELWSDVEGEELRWIAAVMKDSRGGRRQTPATARAAAEPVVRRADPSVVPASIVCRRSESGSVELTFLPLINFKGRWWKLLGWVVAWLVGILAVGSLIGPQVARPITAMAVVVLLSVTFVRFMTLNRSAVVFIDAGLVTITQNQQQGNHQIPAETIEFVQTFRNENASELQFLIRAKPKIRILYGRPIEELEWAARFLRVALKHRPAEPEAAMKVDAAAGDCQVCSERMETRVVYCGKCRTPHHEECWSYVGQCSTYGCREIRFTRT